MLAVTSTSIEAVKIITPRSFADSRGELCETYNRNRFVEHGITLEFVQDTQSLSVKTGTIRGLHFQNGPAAQGKLARVLRGSIFGVAVDLRRSSPTYGKWTAERLSAAKCQADAGAGRICARILHARAGYARLSTR